jgi:hypothetical protein
MKRIQYRIGTVTFPKEMCPTWDTRSMQMLKQLGAWAREGWNISRLNSSAHIRLQSEGFCVLLERPLAE